MNAEPESCFFTYLFCIIIRGVPHGMTILTLVIDVRVSELSVKASELSVKASKLSAKAN